MRNNKGEGTQRMRDSNVNSAEFNISFSRIPNRKNVLRPVTTHE